MAANAPRHFAGQTRNSVISYSIRRSTRARHVWLRFSKSGELVVVVPKRFDIGRVASIVDANRLWIERAAVRVNARREALEDSVQVALPQRIVLPALDREWAVEYRPTNSPGVRVVERPGNRLVLYGKTSQHEQCRDALCRWFRRKGHASLVPLLQELAATRGFTVTRVTVRSQRTRWASCSRNRAISLNIRLLFVPPELVRHVMLHELCHTKKMDHTQGFWELVAHHDPNWREHRRRLRMGWRSLPGWLTSPATA